LRRRPQIEHLDLRCLLTSGAGIGLKHHVAEAALAHRHALVRHQHGAALGSQRANHPARHELAKFEVREQPAGAVAPAATSPYDALIGATAARAAYNVDGRGMTVAVIDTGVDYNNPALGGGLGSGYKVIAGYDFADGTANPMATVSQHGTAIAGVIGSSDPSDLGVAPGVKLVALRVTDGTNTSSLDSIANALQWVIDNREKYNITAINMSLADGGNYAQNWFANDGGDGERVTKLIAQLAALNIPVVAATGNSFNGMQGEGFAAIAAGTISVTATDLSGNLLANAQRLGSAIGGASATTIAAPGEGLTAPMGDAGTATVGGTSFATALATGGVSLLQEIYQSRFGSLPTVSQLKTWLQQGATPANDPATGITIGQLNILKSASLIPQPGPPATPRQPATPSPSVVPADRTNSSPSPSSTPAPAVSVAPAPTTTWNIQVFVNGRQINSPGSASSGTAWLNQSTFQRLLEVLTSSAPGGADQTGQSVTQVQIWNA
jgi:type VI secretion system secreted protein VgrG